MEGVRCGSSGQYYHVFLSFSGDDVRKTLVDHLNLSFTAAGLNVFLDSEKIERGDGIQRALEEAIESSEILIPIFTQRYADSTWCLNELLHMFRSHKTIMPLFYKVDPGHVQCTDVEGPYAAALRRHSTQPEYQNYIQIWKEALHTIALRSGWTDDTTSGFEGKLVKQVVMDVLKKLHIKKLHVPEHCVGVEKRVATLMKLLDEKGVDKVGIWGMGGLGKTTLVKALFNAIYPKFDASSFLSNVRECAEQVNGLRDLQIQMTRDLLKVDLPIHSIDHGRAMMREHLQSKKVLVVLDDVDSQAQLDALVGDWFAEGSRIIITTRKQETLKTVEKIHEVEKLEDQEALELFSWHAFLRSSPLPEYEHLSTKLTKACGGLPLSLEVLGSHLYHKEAIFWEEAMSKIQHLEYGAVYKSLKISFDGLSSEEQQIFKDIACFFLENERAIVAPFWKDCGYNHVYSAIENLKLNALITVSDDNRFHMHNHLRDLGRELVAREKDESSSDPSLRSRLWNPRDIYPVLEQKEVSPAVRGLKWAEYKGIIHEKGLVLPMESLGLMPKLQFLVLEAKYVEHQMVKLPPKLKWLTLGQCTLKCLPSEWNMEHLIILDLSGSKIVQLWNESSNSKMPKNLRVLKLNNCYDLQKLPDFSNIKSLVRLELRECSLLSTIPYSIRCLQELDHLDLSHHYSMSCCFSTRTLPDSIGFLRKLKYLDLSRCIKALPDSIGQLQRLRCLRLSKCQSLQGLPETLTKLSYLETLMLDYTTNIKQLPNSFGEMRALRELDMSFMEDLEELPSSLGSLSCLEKLNLQYCRKIKALPTSVHQLKSLSYLNMNSCSRLYHLPEEFGDLLCLEELLMEECLSLCELPQSFGNLKKLKTFKISGNPEFRNFPKSFGNLVSLRFLSLPKFPTNLRNLSCLHRLQVSGCQISECGSVWNNDDLLYKLFQVHQNWHEFSRARLSNIAKLFLHRCDNLVEVPALPQGVVEVHITKCWQLIRIPIMSTHEKLKVLNLSSCKRLSEIPALNLLESLTEFNLDGCKKVTSLVGIEKLKKLRKLRMCECRVPPEIFLQWIQELPCLEEISTCTDKIPACLEHEMRLREPAFKSVYEYCSREKDSHCRGAVFCFVLKKGISEGEIKVWMDMHNHPHPHPEYSVKAFMDKDGIIDEDEVYAICVLGMKHPLIKWFGDGNTICCTEMGKSWVIEAARLQLLKDHGDGTKDAFLQTLASDLSPRM